MLEESIGRGDESHAYAVDAYLCVSVILAIPRTSKSQKAILQAEDVARLTRLAFIFIPLSFTASFFGMNFSQFTNGALLSIWIWFVVSVPFLLVSLALIVPSLFWAFARQLRSYATSAFAQPGQ